jgi:hypothetical protein
LMSTHLCSPEFRRRGDLACLDKYSRLWRCLWILSDRNTQWDSSGTSTFRSSYCVAIWLSTFVGHAPRYCHWLGGSTLYCWKQKKLLLCKEEGMYSRW